MTSSIRPDVMRVTAKVGKIVLIRNQWDRKEENRGRHETRDSDHKL